MLPECRVRTQGLSGGAREEERTSKRRGGQQESELEPSVKKCHKRQPSFPRLDRPTVGEEGACRYDGKPSGSPSRPRFASSSGSATELAAPASRPAPSPCSRSAGCRGDGTPGKARQIPAETAGEERAGAAAGSATERPPAASPSLSTPAAAPSAETESGETRAADGQESEGNRRDAPAAVRPASSHLLRGTADGLPTDRRQREGAAADSGAGAARAPLAEKQEAGHLEGNPGRRSPSRPRRPEGPVGGLSSTLPASPRPPLLSLRPRLSTPNTPSPENDGKSDKEVDQQAAAPPPPFRLDHRKRNSCFALLLRNGVSPSYENLLRSEMEALGVKDAGAAGGPGASAKEPKRGLDLQGCSSTLGSRLSSSMLRGKIQKLPFYLSRSQELHSAHRGNSNPNDSHSSSGSSEPSLCTAEVTAAVDGDARFAAKAGEIGNRSEERAHLGPDARLSESSLSVKNDDSAAVSSSADLKPETRAQPDPSFGCQGPASQFEPGEGSNAGVSNSFARTAENGDPKQACGAVRQCESEQPLPLPQPWPHPCPGRSAGPGCASASGGAEKPAHREACGCRTVYANCFSGDADGSGFDEELTVHEFSRRTQGAEGAPLTSPLPSSFSSPSFPSFPAGSPLSFQSAGALSHSASTETSPLLASPATPTPPEEALTQLRTRRYRLPGGFSSLQRDVEELLALLQGPPWDRWEWDCRDGLFSDSGRLLHAEARRLMSGCQQVTRVGQTPEETLQCLADGFRALVRLAGSCLRSPGGAGSRAQALGALRDIAAAYGEFARAAERASGRESCQDLSVKLLARQCTALTTSIFCLTQLYCTITSL